MAASAPDWDKIRNEYVTTHITQRALARKYGITRRAVQKHSTAEHWVDAREEHRAKLSKVSAEAASKVDIDYKGTIYETAFNLAAQLRDLVASGNIVEMGLRPRDVTGALKDIADILHVKDEADVREQEARINKLVKDAQREDEGGKAITVRIEGAGEGWAE